MTELMRNILCLTIFGKKKIARKKKKRRKDYYGLENKQDSATWTSWEEFLRAAFRFSLTLFNVLVLLLDLILLSQAKRVEHLPAPVNKQMLVPTKQFFTPLPQNPDVMEEKNKITFSASLLNHSKALSD